MGPVSCSSSSFNGQAPKPAVLYIKRLQAQVLGHQTCQNHSFMERRCKCSLAPDSSIYFKPKYPSQIAAVTKQRKPAWEYAGCWLSMVCWSLNGSESDVTA